MRRTEYTPPLYLLGYECQLPRTLYDALVASTILQASVCGNKLRVLSRGGANVVRIRMPPLSVILSNGKEPLVDSQPPMKSVIGARTASGASSGMKCPLFTAKP